jgi:hypothetical protein
VTTKSLFVFVLVILTAFAFGFVLSNAQPGETTAPADELAPEDKLVIVWTTGDRDVALNMVFMYAFAAPKYDWWQDITFVVWGPSEKLLAEDIELQEYLKKMTEIGITVKACKACSDIYGVSEKLEACGVNVKYMGGELTNFIKEGRHVITF